MRNWCHLVSVFMVILSGLAYLNGEDQALLPAVYAVVFQLWGMEGSRQ